MWRPLISHTGYAYTHVQVWCLCSFSNLCIFFFEIFIHLWLRHLNLTCLYLHQIISYHMIAEFISFLFCVSDIISYCLARGPMFVFRDYIVNTREKDHTTCLVVRFIVHFLYICQHAYFCELHKNVHLTSSVTVPVRKLQCACTWVCTWRLRISQLSLLMDNQDFSVLLLY